MLFRAAVWRFARYYGKPYVATTPKAPMGERRENPVCVLMTAIRRNFEGPKNREERERVAVKPDVAL